jgi:signal transduction histidine kinase
MQRRAALMNAVLEIRSEPGKGTEITLLVDIP